MNQQNTLNLSRRQLLPVISSHVYSETCSWKTQENKNKNCVTLCTVNYKMIANFFFALAYPELNKSCSFLSIPSYYKHFQHAKCGYQKPVNYNACRSTVVASFNPNQMSTVYCTHVKFCYVTFLSPAQDSEPTSPI